MTETVVSFDNPLRTKTSSMADPQSGVIPSPATGSPSSPAGADGGSGGVKGVVDARTAYIAALEKEAAGAWGDCAGRFARSRAFTIAAYAHGVGRRNPRQ